MESIRPSLFVFRLKGYTSDLPTPPNPNRMRNLVTSPTIGWLCFFLAVDLRNMYRVWPPPSNSDLFYTFGSELQAILDVQGVRNRTLG